MDCGISRSAISQDHANEGCAENRHARERCLHFGLDAESVKCLGNDPRQGQAQAEREPDEISAASARAFPVHQNSSAYSWR
jgi:hypothetical protein